MIAPVLQTNNLMVVFFFFQTDVQKILRNARKLPDKTQTFYKVGLTEPAQTWKYSWTVIWMVCFLLLSVRSSTVCAKRPWLLVSGSSSKEWPTCLRESALCCQTRLILMLLFSSPTPHSNSNWPALAIPSMLLLITTLPPCTPTSQAEPHLN